jgi:hypothetical protein
MSGLMKVLAIENEHQGRMRDMEDDAASDAPEVMPMRYPLSRCRKSL